MTSPHAVTQALLALVKSRMARPFAWGTNDCAIWAFDAVHATTGRDVVVDLRGSYLSARGAMRVLAAAGGLQGLADSRLGARIATGAAPNGSVALLAPGVCAQGQARIGALGVALGTYIVAQGETGLVVVPRAAALAWWGVP